MMKLVIATSDHVLQKPYEIISTKIADDHTHSLIQFAQSFQLTMICK
jgi:REP element-mobilizing transposase RayT